MSFNMGSSEQTSNTTQNSETKPYGPAVGPLNRFINQLNATSKGKGQFQPNAAETAAFDDMRTIAEAGNPYADDIDRLANDMFGAQSRSGEVQAGYSDLERRLQGTADGTNLDIENNPYVREMLNRVTSDATNRINSQFAAAGRDFSGYNQRALGEGITAAQLPVLADLYKHEQGRSDAAARDLFGAKRETAVTSQELDRIRDQLRAAGIEVGNMALDAQNWGPQQILAIEEAMKNVPYDELDRIGALLFPAAGLGGTTNTTGTSNTENEAMGFGLSEKATGAGISALAKFLLSDARAKTDIARIGALADGTPIYRYRYKGYPFWHMGVLAQEVEASNPDAVREIEGMKFVDVLKATAKSEAILKDASHDAR